VIEAEDLRRHVEFLASDAMRGRPTPSPELDRAAQYIAEAFQHAGLEPLPDATRFEHRFECGEAPNELGANVLGYRPGTGQHAHEAVIVSAHYDRIGRRRTDAEDRNFHGANDHASGVAVPLAIAQALSGQSHARSIIFATFCGEELGLLGSRHYVNYPSWPLEHTAAVVNLEMLGRPIAPPAAGPVIAWITGYEYSTFPEYFVELEQEHGVRFSSARDIGPQEGNAFNRSDNYPFADASVVAHTIASGTLDEYYHAVHDEPDSLDYPRMAQIAQAIAAGVVDLANAEDGPHWGPKSPFTAPGTTP